MYCWIAVVLFFLVASILLLFSQMTPIHTHAHGNNININNSHVTPTSRITLTSPDPSTPTQDHDEHNSVFSEGDTVTFIPSQFTNKTAQEKRVKGSVETVEISSNRIEL